MSTYISSRPIASLATSPSTVESAFLEDIDTPIIPPPGPIDGIDVTSTNDSNQVEAHRRWQKAASRQRDWVRKVTARMAGTIQLINAETRHVVGGIWRPSARQQLMPMHEYQHQVIILGVSGESISLQTLLRYCLARSPCSRRAVQVDVRLLWQVEFRTPNISTRRR